MGTGLAIGSTIRTTFGEEWTVTGNLGEGGQGYVYRVERDGVEKALKWYKPRVVSRTFYEHIRKNVMDGSPSDGYVWPMETTEFNGNTFGYIMELRPEGFYDMTDILLRKVEFQSFRRTVDASMGIVNNLRILHNKGYSYQDLNDGNFFINPENGQVLICDNDNVATAGLSTGVLGKPRYMAPEIVLRHHMPDIHSDRFSLALIIFRLLTLEHPLEGKRVREHTMSPEVQTKLYGKDPVFMFDPEDERNRPDPELNRNAIAVWECLPGYMRNIFIRAFGKEGLKIPGRRPTEAEWIDALVRFRSNIVTCSCGNEIFVSEDDKAICDQCGKSVEIPLWLELPEYRIPGMKGSRIYRCQTCIANAEDALKPEGSIIAARNDPSKLGVRNMSDEVWHAVTTKGVDRTVKPGDVVPLKEGIQFDCNGSTIMIKGGKINAQTR